MVQFGPADYSMSIGVPGQWDRSEVREAERYTIETALNMGIVPRAEIMRFEQAAYYIDMGVKDFCLGTDADVIYHYCDEQAGLLAKSLGR